MECRLAYAESTSGIQLFKFIILLHENQTETKQKRAREKQEKIFNEFRGTN